MKRQHILPVLAILALLLFGLFPAKVQAASVASGTCGENVSWSLDDAGVLRIYGTGNIADYEIMGDRPWDSYRTSIKTVEILNGVTGIGEWAFYYCTELTSVTIPDSVTTIGNGAFASCYALPSVMIPNSVTQMGYMMFYNCTGLTSVGLSETITSIGSNFFYRCTSLTSITIPESVTEIGSSAFSSCDNLQTVHYPGTAAQWNTISINSSNNDCLNNATKHYNANFEGGVCTNCGMADPNYTIIGSGTCGYVVEWTLGSDGVLILTGDGSMRDWDDDDPPWYDDRDLIKKIVIKDGVTSIGESAFSGCSNLTSVTIPDSVTSIDGWAFSGCTSLASVTVPDSVTSIGISAFGNTAWYKNQPEGVVYIGKQAYQYKGTCSGAVEIKPGTLGIAGNAFQGCTGMTSVSIPDSVTRISVGAFQGCTGLQSLYIPGSVMSIQSNAFNGCSGLQTVTLADGVRGIGEAAFVNCTRLQSIEIPESVSGIGSDAFWGCYSLTSVVIPDGVSRINDRAFYNCSALTSIVIPVEVTYIGEWAFRFCSNLSTVHYTGTEMQWGSISIGESNDPIKSATKHYGIAFVENCINSGLYCMDCNAFVTKKNSVDGTHLFEYGNCTRCGEPDPNYVPAASGTCGENLTWALGNDGSLVISGTGPMTNWSSSYDRPWHDLKDSIWKVVIRDGVTSVGDRAFDSCLDLRTVIFGNSITEIGDSAFAACISLSDVDLPEGLTTIGADAFELCDLQAITIPASVTSIGEGAFQYCTDFYGFSVNENNPVYSNDDSHVLFNKDKTELIQVPTMMTGDYIVPGSVTKICPNAFYACEQVTGVTLPDSIKMIGDFAFGECDSLGSVYYLGTEADRENIVVAYGNRCLTDNSVWYYNSCVGAATHIYSADYDGTCDRCGRVRILESLAITNNPNKLSYIVGEEVDVTGIAMQGRYTDGTTVVLGSEAVTSIVADLSTEGKKTVTVAVLNSSAEFEIFVHNVQNTTVTVDSSRYPQSSHSYENNLNETKTFTYAGATSLTITFSANTKVENNYDKIYVYDGSGNLVAEYTGTAAAGKRLVINGDTFKITLKTDVSVTEYGYAFSSIKATTKEVIHPSMLLPCTATCTQAGLSEGSCCEICGLILVQQQPMEALGHNWEAATCTEPSTCDRCGETEGEALGHDWRDATCTEPSTCNRCGETEGEALGHDWRDATCTEPSTCNRCGVIEGEALGHDWRDATCTEPSTCNRCGETRGEALGHAGAWFELVPAGCEEDGIKARICDTCGDTESDVLPATGHNYTEVVVAPTCTEEGYTARGCFGCGDVEITDYVPAKGHTWSAWVQKTPPTCKAEGVRMRFCYCGIIETMDIERLPHTYEDEICTGCGTSQYFRLILTEDTRVTLDLTEDVYIGMNGFDLSGTIVTNGFKVYGMDSTTDEYTCDNIGYFTCVDENGNLIVPERIYTEGEKQYMAICTEDRYSFHRFFVGTTHMSLEPETIGLGYKAAVFGDEMVFAELAETKALSFKMQLEGYNPVYRYFDSSELTSGESIALRIRNYDVENYSEHNLYAQVILTLNDGTVIEAEPVSLTFRWLTEQVNENYTDYTADQLASFKAMLQAFDIVKKWDIPNLI